MVLVKLSSYLVQGILATSRALGDYPLKDQKLITAEPDVLHFDLAKVRAPRFAILAQLVAGLAPEGAREVLGGHARDVQGELLVAVPAKDKVCITTGYFIEKL